MGADVLYLNRVDWLINSWDEWLKEQKRPAITRDQVRAVERELSVAQSVAPVVELNQSISYNDRNSTGVSVDGTTDQFIAVRGFALAQGRFFTSLESDAGRDSLRAGNKCGQPAFSTTNHRSARQCA